MKLTPREPAIDELDAANLNNTMPLGNREPRGFSV
jgi:hypothetical protein